jgi:hypothetical protein
MPQTKGGQFVAMEEATVRDCFHRVIEPMGLQNDYNLLIRYGSQSPISDHRKRWPEYTGTKIVLRRGERELEISHAERPKEKERKGKYKHQEKNLVETYKWGTLEFEAGRKKMMKLIEDAENVVKRGKRREAFMSWRILTSVLINDWTWGEDS